MSVTLLTGPVASGKSSLAVRMARSHDGPVTIVATAEARDEEMRERIDRHRAERPADWTVVEEPLDLAGTIARLDPGAAAIVDCLTLWVTNVMLADGDALAEAQNVAAALASREAPTIVVTNEVGWGIVPTNDLARAYRETLGRVNRTVAAVADRVLLVVSGRGLELHEVDR